LSLILLTIFIGRILQEICQARRYQRDIGGWQIWWGGSQWRWVCLHSWRWRGGWQSWPL